MRVRKGSEQPIWLLVAVILALVIGAAMYQLVIRSTGRATFADFIKGMDDDTAKTTMRTMCTKMKDNDWQVPLGTDDFESLYKASLNLGWVTEAKYDAGEKITTCDCATFLWKEGHCDKREVIYAVAVPGSTSNPTTIADVLTSNGPSRYVTLPPDGIHRNCHYKATCSLDPVNYASACAELTR